MEPVVHDLLSRLEMGEPQRFENMTVFPLFSDSPEGPPYNTLKEAFEWNVVTVTEVSASGSVPELRVANRGDIPLLLLEGEEVSGAKQNRVLNTTILLIENSETVIPVSCTERGRWSSASPDFTDSGLSRRGVSAWPPKPRFRSPSPSPVRSDPTRARSGPVSGR